VLIDNMLEALQPLHGRRAHYVAHPDEAVQVLEAGSQRARVMAQETMAYVRDAMHI
jgi:hypothetical protein